MDADRDATSTRSTRRRRAAPLGIAPLGIAPLALGLLLAASTAARAANNEDLMRLLEQRRCPGCRLQDADLVHAELRDADLQSAILKRANLSGALLDGAQLQGADLSFTSLVGASLRGADLRGARLEGTDLRQSDLSGAQLDAGALEQTHWQQARGAAPGSLGYAALHNAGVAAAEAGRFQEAEVLFGERFASNRRRRSPGWRGASAAPSRAISRWPPRTCAGRPASIKRPAIVQRLPR